MIRQREELMKLFNNEKAFDEDVEDALDHGMLVSNLAFLLAKELGYDQEFCENLAAAGMVHDVGKLELGNVLYGRRKDVLKIEEMKYVRLHPTLGYKILCERNIGDEELRLAVLHHHENYDGSGYPDNVKGEKIPLASRILRVCDVYSALISERPYRAAFDPETAMELMIDEVKNFDMKIFLALMQVAHSEEMQELMDYASRVNRKAHMKEA